MIPIHIVFRMDKKLKMEFNMKIYVASLAVAIGLAGFTAGLHWKKTRPLLTTEITGSAVVPPGKYLINLPHSEFGMTQVRSTRWYPAGPIETYLPVGDYRFQVPMEGAPPRDYTVLVIDLEIGTPGL